MGSESTKDKVVVVSSHYTTNEGSFNIKKQLVQNLPEVQQNADELKVVKNIPSEQNMIQITNEIRCSGLQMPYIPDIRIRQSIDRSKYSTAADILQSNVKEISEWQINQETAKIRTMLEGFYYSLKENEGHAQFIRPVSLAFDYSYLQIKRQDLTQQAHH